MPDQQQAKHPLVPPETPTIYQQLVHASVQMTGHESDLWCRVTPESIKIVSEYEFSFMVLPFTDAISGEQWYDIPFAYDPFWEINDRHLESVENR